MENVHIYKNYMPQKRHMMLADSLLNALIAFSGALTWSDGVNLLYTRATQLAIRPYDVGIVNSILADLGLEHIKKPNTCAELKRLLSDDKVAFGRIGTGRDSARIVVFVSHGDELLAFSDTNPYSHGINAMWMGNKKLAQSRIRELIEDARCDHMDEAKQVAAAPYQDKETKYFHYFQPNPQANNIGDCVVRAFCVVTGESWESVMRQLASSLDHRNLDFNYNNNFLNLLLDKGFGRCSPVPRMDGRLMTGAELCEWLKQKYPIGNCKVFAFVGSSHVAGVLPYQDEDGNIGYRFHDSWNCTSRKMTEIFIRVDEPEKSVVKPQEKLAAMEVGTFLQHPQYGIGCVNYITPYRDDALVTVQFDAGQKSILKSWAMENCTIP